MKPLLDEAAAALSGVQERAAKAELEALLSGEADGNDAYIEINSGAGGTESQDWASMLLRMYARWAKRMAIKVEELEHQDGDTAGIKSATLLIKGENAYGWLKTEARRASPGAHFAVRFKRAPPHQFRERLGVSEDRRHHRDRDPRQGRAHRHLSRFRRGRPARQQDRQRGAPHAHSHRHRRRLPGRAQPAQEPRRGVGHAARAALRGANCRAAKPPPRR